MPQFRPRRASVTAAGGDHRSQPKPTGTKPTCKLPNEPHRDAKLTAKIPKSVRFDLENALVGLCNVWFEEIKPHLLRNNIKLHVHGDAEDSSEAAEDAPAQACSHLDPGAADCPPPRDVSYADYCTTLQTALNERSRRPPVLPQCPHRQPSVPHSRTPTNQCHTYEARPEQPRALRNRVPPQQSSRPSCHELRTRREPPPQRQPIPPQDLFKLLTLDNMTIRKPRKLKKKRKSNVSHKATQTDGIPFLVPPLLNIRRRLKSKPKPKRTKVASPTRRHSPEGRLSSPNHEPGSRRYVNIRAKHTESAPHIENKVDGEHLGTQANYNFIRLFAKKSEPKASSLRNPTMLYLPSRPNKPKSTWFNPPDWS